MSDLQSFVEEIMDFLTEENIEELSEKAGVKFPLDGLGWSDLCYVCCWMALKGRKIPESLHNRMILGETNSWSSLYARILENRRSKGVADLFNLAG